MLCGCQAMVRGGCGRYPSHHPECEAKITSIYVANISGGLRDISATRTMLYIPQQVSSFPPWLHCIDCKLRFLRGQIDGGGEGDKYSSFP